MAQISTASNNLRRCRYPVVTGAARVAYSAPQKLVAPVFSAKCSPPLPSSPLPAKDTWYHRKILYYSITINIYSTTVVCVTSRTNGYREYVQVRDRRELFLVFQIMTLQVITNTNYCEITNKTYASRQSHVFLPFFFLEMLLFPSIFVLLPFSLSNSM